MSDDFHAFFSRLTEHNPYPYQERLGVEEWPDVVEVPTGLGKTAGVIVSWIWKRLRGDPESPHRLVYCLPMRVLVEQTAGSARKWIERAIPLFEDAALQPPSVHFLMGGEVDVDWVDEPSRPAVVVGTQDMLLSRALMRGYGMSRYQWPIHFGLLHNDAIWVFDEVQLMGPALPTSAQLEAFRRATDTARPCRTVWMSATLDLSWLETVDFRDHASDLVTLRTDDDDRERAAERIGARKRLNEASVRLDRASARKRGKAYLDALADAVLEAHRPGAQTLVILNRVARAQDLYRRLVDATHDLPSVLLLHARFRPEERRKIESELRRENVGGRIVVATQAVEAGVDLSSATLFTELAPWSSMVQRFGRCNRRGEVEDGADIYWIDIDPEADEAAPYEESDLAAARENLNGLKSASIGDLPSVRMSPPIHPVLRRKDFLELFDTEPDLSGFDVDVSPYIRDPGAPQVQVFWRAFEGEPDDEPQATREELCSVSMGQAADYLETLVQGRRRRYWTWNGLDQRWIRARTNESPRPGGVLLLRAEAGGYSDQLGFAPGETDPVVPLECRRDAGQSEAMGHDRETAIGRFLTLEEHTANVRRWVARIAESLGLEEGDVRLLDRAALWHDVGKAHPAFQTALLAFWEAGDCNGSAPPPETVWAKSAGHGRLRYRVKEDGETVERKHFRHELASLLAWLENGGDDDRIAYLVAAHHGKLRLALRALPGENTPPGDTRFARGVWDGDVLPALELDGLRLPPTEMRLEVMELGIGAQGPSWTERTRRLLSREGPFRLAWLEALLRIADQRASAEEREAASPDSMSATAQ